MGASTGDGVRQWLAGLPTTTRRVVVAGSVLAVYAVVYVLLVLLLSAMFDHPPDWTGPLGPMVGSALGVALVAYWQRRRMGGGDRVCEFTRALRRRRLPDGADPGVWGPLLARERRVLRRWRAIVLPLVAVVFAAAAVSAAVVGLGWAGGVSMLLAGAVLIALLWLASRRNLARIDLLADQLARD